ncbi:MAG: hypothetical protein EXR62_04805 [Chloroflexi bacterium]|nr:hypothetical protein [Chloroflexota bacterium]
MPHRCYPVLLCAILVLYLLFPASPLYAVPLPRTGTQGAEAGGYQMDSQEGNLRPSKIDLSWCADSFEEDNVPWLYPQQSKRIAIGEVQMHNFCPEFDQDVVVFTATAGKTYVFRTFGLGPSVDTVLELRNSTLQLMGSDDDGGRLAGDGPLASRITFRVPTSGDFYIIIYQYDGHRYGPDTRREYSTYSFQVQEQLDSGSSAHDGTETGLSLWMNKGCAASYAINESAVIYFHVPADQVVQLFRTNQFGTILIYENRLTIGTYAFIGIITPPAGMRNLTLIGSDSGLVGCSYSVVENSFKTDPSGAIPQTISPGIIPLKLNSSLDKIP